MDLRALTWLALGLVVVWFVAGFLFELVGAAIHLLLLVAAALLVIRVFQRARKERPPLI